MTPLISYNDVHALKQRLTTQLAFGNRGLLAFPSVTAPALAAPSWRLVAAMLLTFREFPPLKCSCVYAQRMLLRGFSSAAAAL